MRRDQPLGSLPLKHEPVAKEQVHEIVLKKGLVRDSNLNFAFSRQDSDGGAAGGQLVLVQIFVQQPSELVVNIEHLSHDAAIQPMKCLLITRLNPGSDFDRHKPSYLLEGSLHLSISNASRSRQKCSDFKLR